MQNFDLFDQIDRIDLKRNNTFEIKTFMQHKFADNY